MGLKSFPKANSRRNLPSKSTLIAKRPKRPLSKRVEPLRSSSNEKVRLDLQKQRNRQPYILYDHGSFRPEDWGGHHRSWCQSGSGENERTHLVRFVFGPHGFTWRRCLKLLLSLRPRRFALHYRPDHHPAAF